MKFPAPLQAARFVARPNRFTCLVQLPHLSLPAKAHLPDPGRLRELLRPDARVWVEPKAGALRKTAYQVWLVEHNRTLVSLDTRLPNLLVQEALSQDSLPELNHYTTWEHERRSGESRLDFCLSNANETCWVEVKSVTLVEGDRSLFPDAPTARGRKHLAELIRLRRAGARSIVLFIVQRADARSVAANHKTDPAFAAALRNAWRQGVELIAYTCSLTTEHAALNEPIPVIVE